MKFKPGDVVKILVSVNNIEANICYGIVISTEYLSHHDVLIQGINKIQDINSIYLYPADHDGYMVIYDPEIPF